MVIVVLGAPDSPDHAGKVVLVAHSVEEAHARLANFRPGHVIPRILDTDHHDCPNHVPRPGDAKPYRGPCEGCHAAELVLGSLLDAVLDLQQRGPA